MIKKGGKLYIFFSLFALFSLATVKTLANIPKRTVDIEFEIEVEGTVAVDVAYLDFGNILKNSKQKITALSYLELKTVYPNDMHMTTSFQGGTQEGEYTKYQLVKKGGSTNPGDIIDTYLYNIKSQVLQAGDKKVPIIGEIREVGDVSLGEYEKTVVMNIEINPIT